MAKNADVDPAELAKNIQKNVDTLLGNPSDTDARKALQQDALVLSAKVTFSSGGIMEDDKANLQNAVQAQLDQLELQARGTIPSVTILADGQISATEALPGTHTVRFVDGETTQESNFREVSAAPNQATTVLEPDGDDNKKQQ
jgi:hypothetical protein